MSSNRNHPAFKETAKPFFDVVMTGLSGEVDGENFWDAVADDVIFEFAYNFPGLPQTLNRAEYMKWFADYPNVLTAAELLHVFKDTAKNVVILDYEVRGTSATGKNYRNRFCSIVTLRDKKIIHWIDFADTFSAFQAMQTSTEFT